jgi:hypothetical protein
MIPSRRDDHSRRSLTLEFCADSKGATPLESTNGPFILALEQDLARGVQP